MSHCLGDSALPFPQKLEKNSVASLVSSFADKWRAHNFNVALIPTNLIELETALVQKTLRCSNMIDSTSVSSNPQIRISGLKTYERLSSGRLEDRTNC